MSQNVGHGERARYGGAHMWQEKVPLIALLPLRLVCGWVITTAGLGKVAAGWLLQPLLNGKLDPLAHPAPTRAWLAPLLQHVALHAQAYSRVLALTELVCGAALLLGLCTRLAVPPLLLLSLLLMLLGGTSVSDPAALLQSAVLLTLSLGSSGRVLGADALLREQLPSWLT